MTLTCAQPLLLSRFLSFTVTRSLTFTTMPVSDHGSDTSTAPTRVGTPTGYERTYNGRVAPWIESVGYRPHIDHARPEPAASFATANAPDTRQETSPSPPSRGEDGSNTQRSSRSPQERTTRGPTARSFTPESRVVDGRDETPLALLRSAAGSSSGPHESATCTALNLVFREGWDTGRRRHFRHENIPPCTQVVRGLLPNDPEAASKRGEIVFKSASGHDLDTAAENVIGPSPDEEDEILHFLKYVTGTNVWVHICELREPR